MFNKLFLICILISICTSNCVVLENICDVFTYNGTQVNSVFRMRFMNQFDSISQHLANESVKYDDLIKNNTQIEMINNSTKLFNHGINTIYSENFINKNLKNVTEMLSIIGDYMKTYNGISPYLNEDNRNKLHQRFESQFRKGISFWLRFHRLNSEIADHMDKENAKIFKESLQNMSIENGEKFAFEGMEFKYIFSAKSIASLVQFLDSRSEQVKSVLITNVLLPFYNPNYEEEVKKTNKCLSSRKLTYFYREFL